ncbi:carboxynorspermidine decarboxylase [Candidatus Liberibacter asiaticus]|uniref:Carboxynorspermidine/carboxyspermidine decarboxylase n=3 Tax=Liberibacter asiaticus TaxID=34021 RepID=C6XFR1_LIBAP|nr:carboxynorspermidine decarboxylase [Candidatus Liberibacter asiaticus]ACT57214.1 carboxynorspermidine decarboxylase [Candidatus Liberibacter asiaticus str. psy62]AGH16826.1 carboxynorspermidine decarboxylase [Candidatus Liberibacter asiaticus str. gxpsy]ALK07186.1 carboxynorspermidine decarboxylase [Candidatus Liberibacter asiaticus]ASK52665.1 carboxynorspermidine decarboxylase [Candidatus Liberibacter asiaticus]AWL13990.1 carboxynorspermidine decarboxylase [Candidatus Liberibacter asiaticu
MIKTPYYLIDKQKLLNNLDTALYIRKNAGVKLLLALKCFAAWGMFDTLNQYMDGTTSSSLYEVMLGHEKFGGETHAYNVAYKDCEIDAVLSNCDTIIFNTVSQLNKFKDKAQKLHKKIGLRINPSVSYSKFILADPNRPFSRLGEKCKDKIESEIKNVNGLMFHNNCENKSFLCFSAMLKNIEKEFGHFITQIEWISLGGGIHFTDKDYPVKDFCQRLKEFSEKYSVQIYLEPGEAIVTNTTTLNTTVLDISENIKNLVIVDSSVEAHVPDYLLYQESATIYPNTGPYTAMVCGRSCLAGDIFGEFHFEKPVKIGDRISFEDVAGYNINRKNWFNGINMPTIAVKNVDGTIKAIREFSYNDYYNNLS